ncbi:MAG: hypothetical protein KF727_15280 [Microbacteriaceae bacterium]|nr:hypothetical protein [Microbacteriaceae bacterium]
MDAEPLEPKPSRFRVVVDLTGEGWTATVPEVPGMTVTAPDLIELDRTVRGGIRLHDGAPAVQIIEPIQLDYDYAQLGEGIAKVADVGRRVREHIEADAGTNVLLRVAKAVLLDAQMPVEDMAHLLGISQAHVAELGVIRD